jgi:triacylglycerol lipase
MSFFVQLPVSSYPEALPFDFGQGFPFSYAAAQSMMWLSQLSYESSAKIDGILTQWQLQLLAHLHSPNEGPLWGTATQGFVCRRDGATIVAFAGTDAGKIKTVLTDFETVPDDDSGLHPGFRDALAAVWTQLQAAVPSLDGGRLFVAGHSLGGALAVLAAFRLQDEANITADAVYTFGLPRVGGTKFGTGYELALGARTFRLVDGYDPVPAVPPTLLGFRHVGRRLSCAHDRTFDPISVPESSVDDQPSLEQAETDYFGNTLADLLSGRVPAPAQPGPLGVLYTQLPVGLADHMQARYLRALGTPVG